MDIAKFKCMIDYANRRTLTAYDDGRLWFYLKNDKSTLEEIAFALYSGDADFIKNLSAEGSLFVSGSLKDIHGEHFLVIYFDNAYIVKHYNAET